MPCFKGLAVSIHTPNGPISEYSIQRQSRVSRIASFIPVPAPKIPDSGSGKPEQSTFAISITLLIPGQDVPYSTPKVTPENPLPKPKTVGGLPGITGERGQYSSMVAPYKSLTSSPNETIAAYIYFDGRQKEEVATLLRRSEETWVNSRWVSVPESEGGGLAEREFLFREVGLERWLNGLDLDGKDVAAKVERRKQKIEKRRMKRESTGPWDGIGDMEMDSKSGKGDKGIMRYGNDDKSPLEDVSDDDMSFSDSDDDPMPESTGQIKVALFRVLASGEIRKGEYAPQFDAHDDDEDPQAGKGNDEGGDADVDHTTSFAKPKSLDPKSISTQTVTAIDPTDKPYAVFTFMYRGERQLQKMGILKDPKPQDTPGSAKRKSLQPDFSNLGPLKPGGTVGFLNFRDGSDGKRKGKKNKAGDDDMDSDDEDEDSTPIKTDDEEAKGDNQHLSPDDFKRQGELSEGLRKMGLKRQHSSEPMASQSNAESVAKPESGENPAESSNLSTTPPNASVSVTGPPETAKPATSASNGEFFGSPLKKQRASESGGDKNPLRSRLGSEISSNVSEVLGSGKGEESKDGSTSSGFGDSLKPREPENSQQSMEEEL